MKPARFQYQAAHSVEEALAALTQDGDEAKVLAGGQSLIPAMRLPTARPAVLVDVNAVAGLAEIAPDGDRLRVGAMTRQRAAERSALVQARAPLLAQALRHVGHPATRTRGTLGGSAAHADPASEIPAVLVALDAEFSARGAGGERRIPAESFFATALTTALEPTELLTDLSVAAQPAGARSAFLEVARRHGDYALVGVAAWAELGPDGAVARARICFTNLSDVPLRARHAERLLTGKRLDDDAVRREVAAHAAEGASPPSDLHATARDREDLAKVLLRRALEAMARGGER